MTSVVEPPSPPVSLQIDTPASASPFPSPSSSFLPPPVPDAHEFALKLPTRKKSALNMSMAESSTHGTPDSASAPNSAQGYETEKSLSETITAKPVAEPTITPTSQLDCISDSQDSLPSLPQPTFSEQDIDMLSPTTPTPASFHFSAAGSAMTSTQTDSQPQSRPTSYHSLSLAPSQSRVPLSPIITNSPTLSPSRPAPPSPAASRRTSTISARSSKSNASSDPLSRSNSRRQSKRGSDGIGGISLVLSPVSGLTGVGTGTAANRHSTLSALSTGSGNVFLAPQNEGDEDMGNDSATETAADVTTPTIAISSSSNAASIVTTLATTATTATPISTTSTPLTSTPVQPAQRLRNRRRSTKVKIHIRDFAFKKSDDKYRGLGSDVPKPNRFARLNKKLGGSKKVRPSSRRWSTASESTGIASSDGGDTIKEGKERRGRGIFRAKSPDDEEDEENDDDDDDDDDDDNDGWFRRGMGRFSWTFGLSNLRKQIQREEEERQRKEREVADSANLKSYPSRDEMDLNFGVEDNHIATPESGRSSSDVYYDAEDTGVVDTTDVGDSDPQGEGEGEGGEEVEEEEELVPGQYRAMFAFEPEGTAEMRLIEDQVVEVVGRGGGVGWAVVVVPEGVEGGVEVGPGIRHALVPESYLDIVE